MLAKKTKGQIVFLSILAIAALILYYKADSSVNLKVSATFLLLIITLLGHFLLAPKVASTSDLPENFADNPEKYDHQIITIQATVVAIFVDSPLESLSRRLINKIRTLRKNPNTKNRYRHLRFLITHPQLKKKEYILVEHNIEQAQVSIFIGSLIELRGQYLHSQKSSRHLYGKIHWTHSPRGYLKVLKNPLF